MIKNKSSAISFLISPGSHRVWLVFTEDLSNKWDLSAILQHRPIRAREQLRVFFRQETHWLWLCGRIESSLNLYTNRRSERDRRGTDKKKKKNQRGEGKRKQNGRGAKVTESVRSDLSGVTAGEAACVKWWKPDGERLKKKKSPLWIQISRALLAHLAF